MELFLQNHQYNYIARQARLVISTIRTCNDRQIIDMVKYSAAKKVVEACAGLSGEPLNLVEGVGNLETSEELQAYLSKVSKHVINFPEITEPQLKRLFPKVKKLRLPDLSVLENRPLTYLSWVDPSTNKKFLVYQRQSQLNKKNSGNLVGIEGQYASTNQKGICAFCNKSGEASFFSVIAKSRHTQSPDYYRTVGQYICRDSEACNTQITELNGLETFIKTVTS